MPKYGLFNKDSGASPVQTYEGDRMVPRGEYVDIVNGSGAGRTIVAVFRLESGQSVKEIPSK